MDRQQAIDAARAKMYRLIQETGDIVADEYWELEGYWNAIQVYKRFLLFLAKLEGRS